MLRISARSSRRSQTAVGRPTDRAERPGSETARAGGASRGDIGQVWRYDERSQSQGFRGSVPVLPGPRARWRPRGPSQRMSTPIVRKLKPEPVTPSLATNSPEPETVFGAGHAVPVPRPAADDQPRLSSATGRRPGGRRRELRVDLHACHGGHAGAVASLAAPRSRPRSRWTRSSAGPATTGTSASAGCPRSSATATAWTARTARRTATTRRNILLDPAVPGPVVRPALGLAGAACRGAA